MSETITYAKLSNAYTAPDAARRLEVNGVERQDERRDLAPFRGRSIIAIGAPHEALA